MDEMRKLLDSLMGPNRNRDKPNASEHFSDEHVCKMFLCGLCPHELFTNTKMDLRECPKLHSKDLQQAYIDEVKATGKDWGYELDLFRECQRLVSDCDRRIAQHSRRIEDTLAPVNVNTQQISAQIQELQEKAEALGEEGNIDESMALMEKAEALRKSLQAEAHADGAATGPGSTTQQQKLRVCDVCSAFLSVYDSDRRLADHFCGKMHLGYLALRNKLDELRERFRPLEDRDRDRQRDRQRVQGARDRDMVQRDQERDLNRERRSSLPQRDRDRGDRGDRGDRDRNRDRDRDRASRDRGDRDREARGGDRDRNRDRHRDDRDRERGRDRDRDRDRSDEHYRGPPSVREPSGEREREPYRDHDRAQEQERDGAHHTSLANGNGEFDKLLQLQQQQSSTPGVAIPVTTTTSSSTTTTTTTATTADNDVEEGEVTNV